MILTKTQEIAIDNQKLHICKVCGKVFKSEEDKPNCCIFCEKDLDHLVEKERESDEQRRLHQNT